MARTTALTLIVVLAASTLADARLPDAPSEEQIRAVVEQVRMTAAGHSTPETRERIAQYIGDTADDTGADEPRLTHHAGTLLIVRGYPWEGLWSLATSAQADWVEPDTLSNIGFALAFVEDHDRAETILLYTTSTWPEFSPGWTNLARVYLDAGRDDLAGEALDRAEEVEAATAVNEELRGRWAIQRGDSAAAADALVDLSNLDPNSPFLDELHDFVSDTEIEAALEERLDTVPMPAHFVRLEEPIDDYEELVLDEVNRGYWRATTDVYGRIGGTVDYATTTLPPEVFNQLPPEMQATLRSLGHGPGDAIDVPRPADSRVNYPRLSLTLKLYQERYLRQMHAIYRDGEVGRLLEAERERQKGYHEELMRLLDAGADYPGSLDRWIDQSLDSLEAAQPGWLAAMATAREQANRVTRRHWMTVAGLISMLPEDWRAEEVTYLRKQVSLSNLNHAGEVQKWIALGQRAVLLNREATFWAADALHTAAAAREREAQMAREGIEEDWDLELEDGEGFELDVDEWWGLNAGVFSVKVQEDQVGISGGELLQGDVSFNWETMEVEMGIGLGVATPNIGLGAESVGGSAKVLGVVRLGGPHGAALGVRQQVQGSVGSPVHGYDANVIDHYDWLVSAGRP